MLPVLGVEVSASVQDAGNHDAGSGRPVTYKEAKHAELQPTTPILRRRRSACQVHVRARSLRQRLDRLRTRSARRARCLLRPDDRVQTNGSRRGSSQAPPKAHAGLDSRGAGRVARRYSAEAELVDLRYRLVGTERFLRRFVQHAPEREDMGVPAWEHVWGSIS